MIRIDGTRIGLVLVIVTLLMPAGPAAAGDTDGEKVRRLEAEVAALKAATYCLRP